MKKIKKPAAAPLNIAEIKPLIAELSNNFTDAIQWIQEQFHEAAEDYNPDTTDPDDAIPIVPITGEQTDAIENETFIQLLRKLGVREPIQEMETYWRIPIDFTQSDLKIRSQLLSGLYDDNALECEITEKLMISDNEDNDDDNDDDVLDVEDTNENDNSNDNEMDLNGSTKLEVKKATKKKNNNKKDKDNEPFDHHKRIIYNESDNDEDQPNFIISKKQRNENLRKTMENKKLNKTKSRRGRIDKFDSLKDGDSRRDTNDDSDKIKKNRKKHVLNDDTSDDEDKNSNENTNSRSNSRNDELDDTDIHSQTLKKRFAELIDSDDSENEILQTDKIQSTSTKNNDNIDDDEMHIVKNKSNSKRKYKLIDSESDDDDDELNKNNKSNSSTIVKNNKNESMRKKRKSNLIDENDSDIDVKNDDDEMMGKVTSQKAKSLKDNATTNNETDISHDIDMEVNIPTTGMSSKQTKTTIEESHHSNENSSHIDGMKMKNRDSSIDVPTTALRQDDDDDSNDDEINGESVLMAEDDDDDDGNDDEMKNEQRGKKNKRARIIDSDSD